MMIAFVGSAGGAFQSATIGERRFTTLAETGSALQSLVQSRSAWPSISRLESRLVHVCTGIAECFVSAKHAMSVHAQRTAPVPEPTSMTLPGGLPNKSRRG